MLFTTEQATMNYNEVSSLFGNLMAFAGNKPTQDASPAETANDENAQSAALIESFLLSN